MSKYGYWDGLGLGTGIAPSPDPPSYPTPGTPSLPHPYPHHAQPSQAQPVTGRGAHIGSSTHLRGLILRVPGYYRGI